jgi:hypothetical protein
VVSEETTRQWEEYAKVNPLMKGSATGTDASTAPTAETIVEEEGTPSMVDRALGWALKPFEWLDEKAQHANEEVTAWFKKKWQTDQPASKQKQDAIAVLREELPYTVHDDLARSAARDFRDIQEGLAEHAGYGTEIPVREGAPAAAGVVGKGGGKLLGKVKKGRRAKPATYRELLTSDERRRFDELAEKHPNYIPGLDDPARALTSTEVKDARKAARRAGPGHHRRPIAFGGDPVPEEGLVETGGKLTKKNPVHVEVTNFWNSVLRRLRKEQE